MKLSIMVKPASSLCNLRCRYCFYHDLAENRGVNSYGVMREDTLSMLLTRAFEAFPETGRHTLSLVYQGGEPMLAGLQFFERMEEMLARMNRAHVLIERCVQTNGTLIDDAWASFFHQHNYLLGISLDGYADIHNEYRLDSEGKGSFNRVMSGIARLKRHDVAFNILSVVTASLSRHGRKVYGFFRRNGWDYLQFIPCIEPLNGQGADFCLSPEAYGRFLVDVFSEYEREWHQGAFVSVRWFDNLIDLAAGYTPETCGMMGVCACQFVVEADGSVYPCDFYVDDAHRLGTVHEMRFQELYESPIAAHFVEESLERGEKCAHCRWFALCRGGCRRYREGTQSRLCSAYEIFFEACGARIARMASIMRRGGMR